jgi:hypothetical protein
MSFLEKNIFRYIIQKIIMETKEIINRLKVMLNLEYKKEQMKSLATLVDGTEVFVMDGDIAPGSILNVVTEGEEQVLAPEGLHETVDGLLVTVGEEGVIVSVEPKNAEEIEAEESVEVEMEESVESVESVEMENGGDMLDAIAELLKPFIEQLKPLEEQLKKVEEEMSYMKTKMSAIADEPATGKIKKTIKAESNEEAIATKLEKIKKIRKGLL